MTTTSDHDPGVRTGRRIGEVDALRGFALFGILIANVVAVTGFVGVPAEEFSFTFIFDSPVDQAVSAVVDAAFLGKFFVLFSWVWLHLRDRLTWQLGGLGGICGDLSGRVQAGRRPCLHRIS